MGWNESSAAVAAGQVPFEVLLAQRLRERPDQAADLEAVRRLIRAAERWERTQYTRPEEREFLRKRGGGRG